MKRATVVSIPHSGTHLAVYMLDAFGYDVRFVHVGPDSNQFATACAAIKAAADSDGHPIIIPHRPVYKVIDSWARREKNVLHLCECYKHMHLLRVDQNFYGLEPIYYHVEQGELATRQFIRDLKDYTDLKGDEDELVKKWKWVGREDVLMHRYALGDMKEAQGWCRYKNRHPNQEKIREIETQIADLNAKKRELQSEIV